MMFNLLLLLLINPTLSQSTLETCLTASLQKEQVVVQDFTQEYKKATFMFNSRLVSTLPSFVVYPKTDSEVQKVVRCARGYNKTVGIKSGGHSYEGYWQGNGGSVAIDLKNLNRIKINKLNKHVDVGGGTLLGPLIGKLWLEDKGALPHGLQPQIGIGGHTLGGGFGLLSRRYGMLVDSLLEMDVVLADSTIVKATPFNRYKDLYLSLAGAGGGSYGVVTKFKFKYIQPPKEIKLLKFNYKVDRTQFNVVMLKLMSYYNSNPSDDVSVFFNVNSAGKIFVGFTISAPTPQIAKLSVANVMDSLVAPDSKEVKSTDFIGAFNYFAGLGGAEADASVEDLIATEPELGSRYFKAKSGYLLAPLPQSAIDQLAQLLTTSDRVGFFLLIDLHGGKIKTPKYDNSWIHRKALASVQIAATSKNGVELMQKVYDVMQPYFYQAYQNYIDVDQKDWLQMYFGELKTKLVATKVKYDPTDMFKFNQSIPLKV